MPSLSSMRSLDPAGDSMQPLGPPVREVREVAPALPKPTGTPGVVQMPDGKLATNLPLPPTKPVVNATDFGTSTGRFRSSEPSFVEAPKAVNNFGPFAALHDALIIAIMSEEYPRNGSAWTPHTPGDTPPNGATWVVLRNGDLRQAHGIRSWGAGSATDESLHAPAYDVVGWK